MYNPLITDVQVAVPSFCPFVTPGSLLLSDPPESLYPRGEEASQKIEDLLFREPRS
jgi:hypothetical protein